jgi:transposase
MGTAAKPTEGNQFWLDHESKLAKLELTAKAYAAERGLSRHALYQARKRLRSLGLLPPVEPLGSRKTASEKAVGYLDRQWPKLVRVLDDGRLPLDTNRVENAIRPFVVGRKAWLFADTVGGARVSANLFSLVENAQADGIEPWAYLTILFERLPATSEPADVEGLLPHRIDREALLRDA